MIVFIVDDNQNRSRATGSMAGEVPDKYYVVQNNEVIRIKYLLVYAQKSAPSRYVEITYKYRTMISSKVSKKDV